MAIFKFEVQSLLTIEITADNVRLAREELTENLENYSEEWRNDCDISDGEEVKA